MWFLMNISFHKFIKFKKYISKYQPFNLDKWYPIHLSQIQVRFPLYHWKYFENFIWILQSSYEINNIIFLSSFKKLIKSDDHSFWYIIENPFLNSHNITCFSFLDTFKKYRTFKGTHWVKTGKHFKFTYRIR